MLTPCMFGPIFLNLESSRLMEASTKPEEPEKLKLGQLLKKVDSLAGKEESEEKLILQV